MSNQPSNATLGKPVPEGTEIPADKIFDASKTPTESEVSGHTYYPGTYCRCPIDDTITYLPEGFTWFRCPNCGTYLTIE